MKRLTGFVALLILISTSCYAQTKSVANFKSEPTGIDSVISTSATPVFMKLKVTKPADVLTVQVTATKITGTTAGVVRLFGSNDGINWVRVKEGVALAASDSLNLANVATAQTVFFYDKPSRYLWYRAGLVGAASTSTKLKAVAVGSK